MRLSIRHPLINQSVHPFQTHPPFPSTSVYAHHTDRPRHLAIYLDTRRQPNPFTPSLLSHIHALTETVSPVYSLTAFLSFPLLPGIPGPRHNPDFLSLFTNTLSSLATSFLPSINLPICENPLHDDPALHIFTTTPSHRGDKFPEEVVRVCTQQINIIDGVQGKRSRETT